MRFLQNHKGKYGVSCRSRKSIHLLKILIWFQICKKFVQIFNGIRKNGQVTSCNCFLEPFPRDAFLHGLYPNKNCLFGLSDCLQRFSNGCSSHIAVLG